MLLSEGFATAHGSKSPVAFFEAPSSRRFELSQHPLGSRLAEHAACIGYFAPVRSQIQISGADLAARTCGDATYVGPLRLLQRFVSRSMHRKTAGLHAAR